MEFPWQFLPDRRPHIFSHIFGLHEGRGQGYKKRKAEEAQEKKDQPASPAAETKTVIVDDPGLLRVKNENGSIALRTSMGRGRIQLRYRQISASG